MDQSALKQLDRRLSIRKKPSGPTRISPNRSRRIIEVDSESEDDFDSTRARLSPVKGTMDPDDDNLEELPVFCFQHVKQTLEQRGTFVNSKPVDFQGK